MSAPHPSSGSSNPPASDDKAKKFRIYGAGLVVVGCVYFFVASTIDALIPLLFGVVLLAVGLLRGRQK